MSEIIKLTNMRKSVSKDVLTGETCLKSINLKGWPRNFDCAQDKQIAAAQKKNIEKVKEHYLGTLQPAKAKTILGCIELLESRYYEVARPPELQKQLDREWIADMKDYPEDLIHQACVNWRNSNQSFAPRSAGVLMESVKPEYVRRKSLYLKAKSVLELI